MNFVINISQYIKTKTHNKPFVITFISQAFSLAD